MSQSFSGKIIIFGEYSVIAGSKAMVMPLHEFSGKLVIPEIDLPPELEAEQSNFELREFFQYLDSHQEKGKFASSLDTCRLETDLDKGLFFQSTIPVQYGAGSSAALVAAIYGAYSYNKIERRIDRTDELLELRKSLGEMESYFHGKSSGIDPLCSYTGRTLIIQNDIILTAEIPVMSKNAKLFLLNSGLKGKTASLVSDFQSRLAMDKEFGRAVREDLTGLVESGIRSLSGTATENGDLNEVFRRLSEWQLENFSSMIPDAVRHVWEDGLNTNYYSLKLCGSGGGGFFLGYTEEWTRVQSLLKGSGLDFFLLKP